MSAARRREIGMTRTIASLATRAVTAAGIAALISAPLHAQATSPTSVLTGRASTITLTPYAGYIRFGDLHDMPTGDDPESDDALLLGAQAEIRLTPRLALFGNAAYARSPWVLVERGPGSTVPADGDLDYWLFDTGLQVQLPFAVGTGMRVVPFVQGGIGAVRYTLELPDDAQSNTDVQANVGVGADVDVGRLGIRLMVKDYITSLQWTDFRAFADVDGARPDDVNIAHNLAFTAGFRLHF